MDWKVLWFGSPAKLRLERTLLSERIFLSLFVMILVKIFLKESRRAIGLVSEML